MTITPNSPSAQAPGTGLNYADAGVSIDAGNALVGRIKPLAAKTARPGVMGGIGGFGALFDLRAAGYTDPILISSTDGVGTKLKLAQETGLHYHVGIDLVAMCVNDLIVQGAEPLFFLDYFACGALAVDEAAEVIAGIAEGCERSGCALVGGETAEMPGMYGPGEYDLAGFAVGAAERDALLPHGNIGPGDILLGLASDGCHSNGFSLIRKIVARMGVGLGERPPFASPCATLAEALLTPTRLYVRPCLSVMRETGAIKALAHITGGGLTENLPRVLPGGVGAEIQTGAWPRPPVFGWLAAQGPVREAEMLRTFNCGIGMIVVCAEADAGRVSASFTAAGETVFPIGRLIAHDTGRDVVVYA